MAIYKFVIMSLRSLDTVLTMLMILCYFGNLVFQLNLKTLVLIITKAKRLYLFQLVNLKKQSHTLIYTILIKKIPFKIKDKKVIQNHLIPNNNTFEQFNYLCSYIKLAYIRYFILLNNINRPSNCYDIQFLVKNNIQKLE